VYGELEVTCPALRREGLAAAGIQDDSIRASLSLQEEALVGFVIDRDGNVDRRSTYVFGEWSAADRIRIARAVSSLSFTPARFAGYRVAQRSHYLIGAPYRSAPGSHDIVRGACIADDGGGIRVRVLSPAAGARRADLERIAWAVAGGPVSPGSNRVRAGVFRIVVMPDGSYHFPHWVSPPGTPVELASALPFRFAARSSDLRPLGVEIEAGIHCP
jgi:hypothetical protein